jgi:hypothetical protein
MNIGNLIAQLLAHPDPNVRKMVMDAYNAAQQNMAIGDVMRGVLRDNATAMHKFAPPNVGTVGLPEAHQVERRGYGWQEPASVDNWRPPGEAAFNRMMDQQDALDRVERARELAKLKGVSE